VLTLRIDYESSIDNVERINKEIDVILAKIKQGNFDPKLLVEKKMGLINSYKENLNKNTFWTYVLNEYIQNKEPLNNIINVERIINNVTKNDIINLANEIFDENYITASMHLDG
jgi:predicted Zn-dependent peptidase